MLAVVTAITFMLAPLLGRRYARILPHLPRSWCSGKVTIPHGEGTVVYTGGRSSGRGHSTPVMIRRR
jgi:hypothetical protein